MFLAQKRNEHEVLTHPTVKNANYYSTKRGFFNCWMSKRKHVNGKIAIGKCVVLTGYLEKPDVRILIIQI